MKIMIKCLQKISANWVAIVLSIIAIIISLVPYIISHFENPEYSIIMSEPMNWEKGDKIFTIYNESNKKTQNINIQTQSFMVLKNNDDYFDDLTLSFPVYGLDFKLKRTGRSKGLIAYIGMVDGINPLKKLNRLQYPELSADLSEDAASPKGCEFKQPLNYFYGELVIFTIITEADSDNKSISTKTAKNTMIFATNENGTTEIPFNEFEKKYYNNMYDEVSEEDEIVKFKNNKDFISDTYQYFVKTLCSE